MRESGRFVLIDAEPVTIDEGQNTEFLRLLKRGILIALQQEGVLSIDHLEQCLGTIDLPSR